MARLKNNGKELLRWKEVVEYPVDNSDCISERVRFFSLRSNGYILSKTKTISTLFDKPDTSTTNWKRYKRTSADNLDTIADKIKSNVKAFKSIHLKSGGVLTYHLI